MAEKIPSTSEWLDTHVISGLHSKKMKLINKSLGIVKFYFSPHLPYHPHTGGKIVSSYYF